ncbi:MAG: CheR family methyltransferase [Promethearchaeota archaeon]
MDKLKDATGIKFEYYQRKFLERRIHFRVKNLDINSYQEYINYLASNPNEINHFLDKFTINYTYFFRNYEVFERFEEFIRQYVSDLKRPIRIWSAPCASGEEPYSIAILFNKLKSKIINFPDYEIVASDIDKTALKIARAGVYGEYSIHEVPKNYLETHFTKLDTQLGPKFKISNEIKNKVEFFEEDIIRGHKTNTKYDVIFCRNLLIYINGESKEKLLRTLENHLVQGGLLILGKTEMLVNVQSNFKSIDTNNHFYVKNKLNQKITISQKSQKPTKIQINKKEIKHKVEKKVIKRENSRKSASPPSQERRMKIKQTEPNKNIKVETETQIDSRKKILDQRELQIIRRLNQIELREKQLNERESKIKQKEAQLGQREVLVGLREKQIEDLLEQIEVKEKDIKKTKSHLKTPTKQQRLKNKSLAPKSEPVDLSIMEDPDRIIHPNIKGELNLPVGHYALINSHDDGNKSSKFSIYGLGSGIALILQDKVHKVYAMSHMILPKSPVVKNDTTLFPHRYIDTSVSLLLDTILYNGANKDNLEAIIVGGANNIYEQGGDFQDNIDAIKKELFSHHINIEKEYLGGISERSIVYDTKESALWLKKKWEDGYRKV